MTNRLYYDNAYLTDFSGEVLACEPDGEFFSVLLDRSAFYPTSGGQPYDTGMLDEARVLDVNVMDGQVWHKVSSPLPVGRQVQGCIDWPRRFDHMQQHAADHMIAGALHRFFGGVTIGLHISDDISTIDVAMPEGKVHLSDADIRRIEADVNDHIQRDVPIRCWFPNEEELASLPLRKQPTVNEHVRIVAIGDDEMVACGGTHPASAGQIGLVKILWTAPARGKMRVAFVAGRRALADYDQCSHAAHQSAQLLSSSIDALPEAVSAALERLKAAETELAKMKKERLLARIPSFLADAVSLPGGIRLVSRFVEADAQQLRELAAEMIRQTGVIALLGAQTDDQALYVFARASDVQINMGALLQDAARPLGGKGGGRPDFAQGGGCIEILESAREKILTMMSKNITEQ